MKIKDFLLPITLCILLYLILYFVIKKYPEFIYPTIFLEFIVYMGAVIIDDTIRIKRANRKKKL